MASLLLSKRASRGGVFAATGLYLAAAAKYGASAAAWLLPAGIKLWA